MVVAAPYCVGLSLYNWDWDISQYGRKNYTDKMRCFAMLHRTTIVSSCWGTQQCAGFSLDCPTHHKSPSSISSKLIFSSTYVGMEFQRFSLWVSFRFSSFLQPPKNILAARIANLQVSGECASVFAFGILLQTSHLVIHCTPSRNSG